MRKVFSKPLISWGAGYSLEANWKTLFLEQNEHQQTNAFLEQKECEARKKKSYLTFKYRIGIKTTTNDNNPNEWK